MLQPALAQELRKARAFGLEQHAQIARAHPLALRNFVKGQPGAVQIGACVVFGILQPPRRKSALPGQFGHIPCRADGERNEIIDVVPGSLDELRRQLRVRRIVERAHIVTQQPQGDHVAGHLPREVRVDITDSRR
jgi:hypothetical protein